MSKDAQLKLNGFNLMATKNDTLFHEDVSLTINAGDNFLIYGPSGSGKTTIYEALSFLTPPTQGEVYWGDTKIDSISIANKLRNDHISLIFSNFNFIGHLNVEDNIILPAAASNKKGIYDRLETLMNVFEFDDTAHEQENRLSLRDLIYDKKTLRKRRIQELSNGQKEIVSMARALILDTPFILADEMLRSFPDHTKKVLWERFYSFTSGGDNPKGLMMITHWDPMLTLIPNPHILRIENQFLTYERGE